MKIGELARRASTPPETIRYYEREGLLQNPGRSDSNYRVYSEIHLERLSFIRHCRALDMTLDEIRALLRYKDAPQEDCSAVNRLLDAHIGHVVQRIAELRQLEEQLRTLRRRCREEADTASCGILNGLHDLSGSVGGQPVESSHLSGSHHWHEKP